MARNQHRAIYKDELAGVLRDWLVLNFTCERNFHPKYGQRQNAVLRSIGGGWPSDSIGLHGGMSATVLKFPTSDVRIY